MRRSQCLKKFLNGHWNSRHKTSCFFCNKLWASNLLPSTSDLSHPMTYPDGSCHDAQTQVSTDWQPIDDPCQWVLGYIHSEIHTAIGPGKTHMELEVWSKVRALLTNSEVNKPLYYTEFLYTQKNIHIFAHTHCTCLHKQTDYTKLNLHTA